MKTSATLLAAALALPFAAAKVSYDGYKAYSIESHNEYEAVEKALEDLEWVNLACTDNHDHLDIAVAPESVEAFEALGLDFKLVDGDFGAAIAEEGKMKKYKRTVKRQDGPGPLPDFEFFDSYHPFEEHLEYLEDIHAAFPDNSEIFVAGESLEGRPIQGIHLWGRDGPDAHEAIVWHGTVHAREWIVAPTLEYILYKLVDGYKKRSCSSVKALDNYSIYIMPVVNPDGFAFTHESTRLWRKNRQTRPGTTCVGTDVNRNWPHQWDVPGGSSTNPCSETYRGLAPGDTPENAVLTNHTLAIAEKHGLKNYIDWHAFSQLILLPYGYSCSAVAPNNDYQMKLAGGVEAAIRSVNGLTFTYGPTCPTIYQTSGVSMDWAFDIAGAELAWGYEMRPLTQGQGGFVLPPSHILLSGAEQWAGAKYLLANM